MNVTIQTSSGSKSKLSIANDFTVYQLKQEIEKIFAFSSNDQKLLFDNTSLSEDNKRLGEYGIGDGSVIHFEFYPRGDMQIFARTIAGRTVALYTCENDKVSDIKEKIREKFEIYSGAQKLFYQGGILDDDKRLNEYQISENSVVNIIGLLRGGMGIFARTMDGKAVAFEVCKTEKIIDIKKKIQEKLGFYPDEQKLVVAGIRLEDDKTVGEYPITEKSIINVVVSLRGGMQIFAKTMEGKTVSLEMCKNDKIIDIKKKVQEKIGLAPHEQILVFQGLILDDDKTADEYQIKENSMINVVKR